MKKTLKQLRQDCKDLGLVYDKKILKPPHCRKSLRKKKSVKEKKPKKSKKTGGEVASLAEQMESGIYETQEARTRRFKCKGITMKQCKAKKYKKKKCCEWIVGSGCQAKEVWQRESHPGDPRGEAWIYKTDKDDKRIPL